MKPNKSESLDDGLIQGINKLMEAGNITHYTIYAGEILGFSSEKDAKIWISEQGFAFTLKKLPANFEEFIMFSMIELERRIGIINDNIPTKCPFSHSEIDEDDSEDESYDESDN